jgi:succinylglutamate desuccinylase
MFNDKQNKLMLEAVEALHKADALMQEALGASDECFDLHCGIESMADDLLEVIQQNNPEEADA